MRGKTTSLTNTLSSWSRSFNEAPAECGGKQLIASMMTSDSEELQ